MESGHREFPCSKNYTTAPILPSDSRPKDPLLVRHFGHKDCAFGMLDEHRLCLCNQLHFGQVLEPHTKNHVLYSEFDCSISQTRRG